MKAPDAFRTISEVAQDLDLPQHVLRFWETRFAQIKPMKRGGGRRYYRPEDVDLLRGIRLLLYSEGFTIRGVQRLLKENGTGFVIGVGQSGSVQAAKDRPAQDGEDEVQSAGAPEYTAEEDDDEAPEPAGPGSDDRPAARPQAPAAADPERLEAEPRGPGRRPLSQEGRRRIDAALADLLEAKRLLDQVR